MEKDIVRWKNYIKEVEEKIQYYQKRLDEAGGKNVKYTLKEKIKYIFSIIFN